MPSPEPLNEQGLLGAQPDKLALSVGLLKQIQHEVLRFNPKDDPQIRVQAIIGIITGDTVIW